MWSRTASRVYLELAAAPAESAGEVYGITGGIDWTDHFDPSSSFAVQASITGKRFPDTPDFTALKAKDGIADYFRGRTGKRPSVDGKNPDIIVHVHVERGEATVSLDISGGGLHRRGYRLIGGDAPLKETVAAAILLRAHWETCMKENRPLVDPMCGSGTILIEAALMAGDIAPGLLRRQYGFISWKGFSPGLWGGITKEAEKRRQQGLSRIPPLYGFDIQKKSLEGAEENTAAAGLAGKITFSKRSIRTLENPCPGRTGLVVTNPPYGIRLGSSAGDRLPAVIGTTLRTSFPGWNAAILSPDDRFESAAGMKADRKNIIYNGPIQCTLYRFHIFSTDKRMELKEQAEASLSTGAEMFRNRLRKNRKRLERWRREEAVSCYRLYDADMPEYALALDVYEDVYGKRRVYVQEYAPPREIEKSTAAGRLKEACAVIRQELGLGRQDLVLQIRRRQRGASQYDKYAQTAERYEIEENGLRFYINLQDYLDTGIFPDHRYIRTLVRLLSPGASFLNLFAYTGTATVYAAAGGASRTMSVDTSRTYLDWTGDNLLNNGFQGERHRMARQDCFEFLRENRERYGLILIDPPTFSNSKDRRGTFDLQRDYAALITRASETLEKGGYLIFSTHARRFILSPENISGLDALEITKLTGAPDFGRKRSGHRCWIISPGLFKRLPGVKPKTLHELVDILKNP